MPEEKKNFLDPKTLEQTKKKIEEFATFNLEREAYFFGIELKEQIKNLPIGHSFSKEYEQILIQSLWIALPLLKEKEILDLYEGHFVKSLAIPFFDPWLKLRAKLLGLLLGKDRDELKKKIRETLIKNQENFSQESISRYGELQKGTVGNWVADYTRESGILSVSSANQAQYLTNSINTKDLSEKSRERLANFLKFYERLKLSSLTPQGYEAPIPVIEEGWEGTIREGVYERLDPAIVKLTETLIRSTKERERASPEYQAGVQEKVLKAYQGDPEKEKSIEKEEGEIEDVTGNNLDKIGQYLLSVNDEIKILACLRILAKRGILTDILVQNQQIKDNFVFYLKKEEKVAEVEGFALQPAAPQYLKMFLQYLLQEKLKLSEEGSARFAVQLFNLLKKVGKGGKYAKLAYFDLEKEKFVWS